MPELYYRRIDKRLGVLDYREYDQLFHRIDDAYSFCTDGIGSFFIDRQSLEAAIKPQEISSNVAKILWAAWDEKFYERPSNQNAETPLKAIIRIERLSDNGAELYYQYPILLLGSSRDDDYQFLLQHLMQETSDDYEFVIDDMTFRYLVSQGMSQSLQELLQKALEELGEFQLLLRQSAL